MRVSSTPWYYVAWLLVGLALPTQLSADATPECPPPTPPTMLARLLCVSPELRVLDQQMREAFAAADTNRVFPIIGYIREDQRWWLTFDYPLCANNAWGPKDEAARIARCQSTVRERITDLPYLLAGKVYTDYTERHLNVERLTLVLVKKPDGLTLRMFGAWAWNQENGPSGARGYPDDGTFCADELPLARIGKGYGIDIYARDRPQLYVTEERIRLAVHHWCDAKFIAVPPGTFKRRRPDGI